MTDATATPKPRAAGKAKAAGAKAGAKAGGKAAGAKAKPAGEKSADQKAKAKSETQIARLLLRAVWLQEWSAANPEGSPEARKTAWTAAREAEVGKKLKSYRRALNMLSRAGVQMSYTPSKKATASDEDDGGED